MMNFWKVAEQSKQEDVLECVTYPMQRIINNGDYTFMWEDDWEVVKMSGEFLRMEWKIINNGDEVTESVVKQKQERMKRYEKALEFYADKKSYATNVIDQWEPVVEVMEDNGEKARKALEEE